MLFRPAFRTAARRSERIGCDPFAVPAIAERPAASASGPGSGPAPSGYPTGSDRATSFALPGRPPLMEALLGRAGKRPLAGPVLQWTHWRDKWRQLRTDARGQQIDLRVRHY